jgi:type II restriction/modification system DNA methylase subunit YeeA
LYESARDNQNGSLEGYNENLVATIRLTKDTLDHQKVIKHLTRYEKNEVLFDIEDAIVLKK